MKESSKTPEQHNSSNAPKVQQHVETPLTHKQKVATILKNSLQLFLGLFIIVFFLAIAKLILYYFDSTFPASILAMLMLFFSLSLGLIKLTWIEFSGNLILKYLGLLFIPVGVGLVNYLELVTKYWFVIVFSLFFTTLVTLFIVGHCYQWLTKEKS